MDLASLTWFAVGASLTLGGALAVARGAGFMVQRFGVSPVLRGLTVVALAVSLPELACVRWATEPSIDSPDLALADLLGSATGNYLFALAVGALALPVVVSRRLLVFAFPLAIVLSFAVLVIAWTGEIAPGVAGFLLPAALLWPFVAALVVRPWTSDRRRRDRRSSRSVAPSASQAAELASPSRSSRSLAIAFLGIVIGATAVYFGPWFFLESAADLAQRLGLDAMTFGLTAIAALTTLPEAVLCLAAGLRGDRESGVAVVVGSGLFNLTAGLGLLALRSTDALVVPPIAFEFAAPAAIAAVLACVPSFYGLGGLSRASGLALFAFYVAFVVYLLAGESVAGERSSDPEKYRFYAMFLLTIGLIATTSIVAMVEGLIRKARLADE